MKILISFGRYDVSSFSMGIFIEEGKQFDEKMMSFRES
jgi:hypothetical protein